jgi:hypothetical protein
MMKNGPDVIRPLQRLNAAHPRRRNAGPRVRSAWALARPPRLRGQGKRQKPCYIPAAEPHRCAIPGLTAFPTGRRFAGHYGPNARSGNIDRAITLPRVLRLGRESAAVVSGTHPESSRLRAVWPGRYSPRRSVFSPSRCRRGEHIRERHIGAACASPDRPRFRARRIRRWREF